MGLFDALFGSSKPKQEKKKDGFFGELELIDEDCWEGKKFFKPLDKEIELILKGDISVPHTLQKRFFSELEKEYDDFTARLAEDFHEQLLKWRNDLTLCNLMRHVSLRFVLIPECKSDTESWELIYGIDGDSHSFVVFMSGWEVKAIRVKSENDG